MPFKCHVAFQVVRQGHRWLTELDFIANRHDHKYMGGTCYHAAMESLTRLCLFSIVNGPEWQAAMVLATRIVSLVVKNLSGL